MVAPGMESAVALLVALTKEAEHALGGVRELPLTAFPVNVGRERRVTDPHRAVTEDQRKGVARPLNDVYLYELPDSGSLHISGAHFTIEYVDGQFFLVDRGSACGTIVGSTRVGGRPAGGRTRLCARAEGI